MRGFQRQIHYGILAIFAEETAFRLLEDPHNAEFRATQHEAAVERIPLREQSFREIKADYSDVCTAGTFLFGEKAALIETAGRQVHFIGRYPHDGERISLVTRHLRADDYAAGC